VNTLNINILCEFSVLTTGWL